MNRSTLRPITSAEARDGARTIREAGYTTDSALDREAIARRNVAALRERGVPAPSIAALLGDLVPVCRTCAAPADDCEHPDSDALRWSPGADRRDPEKHYPFDGRTDAERDEAILAAVRDGAATADAVNAATGVPRSDCDNRLRGLVSRGEVETRPGRPGTTPRVFWPAGEEPPPDPAPRPDPDAERIMVLLADRGPMTKTELVEATGLSSNRVYRAIRNRLVPDGRVVADKGPRGALVVRLPGQRSASASPPSPPPPRRRSGVPARERRAVVLAVVRAGYDTVPAIAEELDVPAHRVRTPLADLVEEGKVRRVPGGGWHPHRYLPADCPVPAVRVL